MQGRRERSYWPNTGATEDAAARRHSAFRRPQPCFAKPSLALERGLVPGLELLAQVAQEAARVGAVDEAVVVRQGDVHDRANRDHVVAELVLDDPRPLDKRVGAEDRGLRL